MALLEDKDVTEAFVEFSNALDHLAEKHKSFCDALGGDFACGVHVDVEQLRFLVERASSLPSGARKSPAGSA